MDDAQLEVFESRIRPRLVSNLLLWIILAFCVVAVIWAALAEVDRSVHGGGRVVPSSQLHVVSNLEGGIVEAILVKAGDPVTAGAPLLRLDQTISAAELGSGNATVAALGMRVARLQAEASGLAPGYAQSPGGSDPTHVATEQALYRSRMAELEGITNAAAARTMESRRAVEEARAVLAARQATAQAAQTQLSQIKPLVDNGIEPQMSLVQAQSNAATTRSEAAAAAAALQRAQANVATAMASGQEQVNSWRARSGTELDTAQAELDARRQSIPALADRLRRTTVAAPIAGRINRVLINTPGGTVVPGSPLVEIVPTADRLVVEAQFNPKDIATVRIGQRAKVGITAYDSSIYGCSKATSSGFRPTPRSTNARAKAITPSASGQRPADFSARTESPCRSAPGCRPTSACWARSSRSSTISCRRSPGSRKTPSANDRPIQWPTGDAGAPPKSG